MATINEITADHAMVTQLQVIQGDSPNDFLAVQSLLAMLGTSVTE